MPVTPLAVLTDALAFLAGGLTTYLDCNQTMTTRVVRVPETFTWNGSVLGLAGVCGAIAAGACVASGLYPDGVLSTVLTLKSADPWRGLVVGASVLVLIRSKLFNIGNSPFGGDYLYDLARNGAIANVNAKWTILRSTFQNTNIDAALKDEQFEAKVLDLVETTLMARAANIQTSFNAKVAAIKGNKPATGASPGVTKTYYRALIGLALDACGPSVVRRSLAGFT